MSVEFCRGSPGKFDSRTLNRTTLNRWTGRSKAWTIDEHLNGFHDKTYYINHNNTLAIHEHSME